MGWEDDRSYECFDIVHAGEQPPRLIERLSVFDRPVDPRVQFRVDAQCPPQAERRAVDEALRRLRARKVEAAKPGATMRFPMSIRVIADERARQDGADVVE